MNGKMISRKRNQDIANKMNEMLGMSSKPPYFVNFPTSKKTSLPSWTANITDPARANLAQTQGKGFQISALHASHV
jgi:hypothetical protein